MAVFGRPMALTLPARESTPRAESSAVPELLIFDVIGASFWEEGVTPKAVDDFLKTNADADTVRVRVNSPGGDVFDGVAIYNALTKASAKVIVDIEGAAFSAASLIAMAGDEIRIAENAMLMIHKAWDLSIGNADDHRAAAGVLDKIDTQMAATYAARSNVDAGEAMDLMAAETWMTGAEAVEKGFADSVTPLKEGGSEAAKAWAGSKVFAQYRHMPKGLVEKLLGSAKALPQPRSETMNEILLKALGLSSDATDEQVRVAIEKAQADKSNPALAQLVLALKEDNGLENDGYAQQIASHDDQLADARAEIAKLKAAGNKTLAEQTVDAAIRAGKAFPAEREELITELTPGGPEACSRWAARVAKRPSLKLDMEGAQTGGKENPEERAAQAQLTDEDREICRLQHKDEKEFLAYKKKGATSNPNVHTMDITGLVKKAHRASYRVESKVV